MAIMIIERVSRLVGIGSDQLCVPKATTIMLTLGCVFLNSASCTLLTCPPKVAHRSARHGGLGGA